MTKTFLNHKRNGVNLGDSARKYNTNIAISRISASELRETVLCKVL